MARYYHIIKKQGKWHLYAGNAITSLMAEPDQALVTRAARSLARHDGAKVVVHKNSDSSQDAIRSEGRAGADALGILPQLASVEKLRPA